VAGPGYLALYAVVIALVGDWSRRSGWGAAHRLAPAGGALLTYPWHAFPQEAVIGTRGAVDPAGNAVFALGALALLLVAARTVRDEP
jgi:CubicO group peptidase (beta-lactamase class C family)